MTRRRGLLQRIDWAAWLAVAALMIAVLAASAIETPGMTP